MEAAYKSKLEELYRSFYPRCIRYAENVLYTYTGRTDGAEDLVQQAFMQAMEKWEQCSQSPAGWLMKTIRNNCMNHLKKYRVRQPILKSLYDQQPQEAPSFSSASDVVLTLKQELPPDDYKILYDFTVNGKSVEEISKETGMPPNNLHVRIYRIRKAARKIIFSLIVIFTLFREI